MIKRGLMPASILPANIKPKKIRVVMICEALPENMMDYFYSSTDSLYVTNTIAAFRSAGVDAESINDIVKKGVYLTVAVREPRKGLTVPAETIEKYSFALEEELKSFPGIKAILLMGDAAI
ncbi:MAG: hypothetical protein AB1690_00375, partial [Candidatus Zixiibacteriota bacterium]